MTALPIDDALPELVAALTAQGVAVLQAPPGAGKTTRVPLALLEAGMVKGTILMLEPRRLAARAAAQRMADTLGEPVGQTVGYRMRGDAKVSKATRIEVVTEGLLTRRLQSDPELDGVGVVIFDEFHERSLNADLGLALTWEVRQSLRPELDILVMSATLDAEPVARMLGDAPVVTSEGKSFPVDTRWLDRPAAKEVRWDAAMADLCVHAMAEADGGLAFLPGEGEIRRVQGLLADRLQGVEVLPLYGAMSLKDQRRAIAPSEGRKLVLATAIAETSLTIDGITAVIDGGLARRARFDPGSGMSQLVTERVSHAEATQRAGRAGRLAPGVCWRLWAKAEHGGLPVFPPAEIEAADLAGLALALADWGAEAGDLAFLTPPPEGLMAEANAVLRDLSALDEDGRITAHGRKLTALPLHPRLANMLVHAGASAADLAALLGDRDPLPRSAPVDLSLRLDALVGKDRGWQADSVAVGRIRAEAKRLARAAPDHDTMSAGEALSLAYPDRIGGRRPGDVPRFRLSGGKGVILPEGDSLSNADWIVVADTNGITPEATVRLALPIAVKDLRARHSDRIKRVESCSWSKREGRVVATREERLGALVLSSQRWREAPDDLTAKAMLDGVRELGLNAAGKAALFLARARLARQGHPELPDVTEAALIANLETWLLPHLEGVTSKADWGRFDLLPALQGLFTWDEMQKVEKSAPAHFKTPLGRKLAIDYSGEVPEVKLRLQEVLGVTRHPMAGGQPIRLVLLSPAQRPIQVTMDLPGFWQTSYGDVRKEMRGRYPKHVWPEDPTQADPTLRAKPRRT